jgi:hypothetical protein
MPPVTGSSLEEMAENRVDVLPVNEKPGSEREICFLCHDNDGQPEEWCATVNCPDAHVFHHIYMVGHLKSSNKCPSCRSAITELRDHDGKIFSPRKEQCSMCKNDLIDNTWVTNCGHWNHDHCLQQVL